MTLRLLVRNLAASSDALDLEALFSPFGQLRSVDVLGVRRAGAEHVTGLVEMTEEHEADAARAALHGLEFRGRVLNVTWEIDDQDATDLAPSPVRGPGT